MRREAIVSRLSEQANHTLANMGTENPRYTIYCKIIQHHCGPQGILRRFNVTEIVTKSKHIKQMLQDREWAQLIPTF